MNCPNCGQPLPEGAKICSACGTVLATAGPASSPGPPPGGTPAIVPIAPPAGALPSTQAAERSSALARGSFWLGLGSSGAVLLTVLVVIVAVVLWVAPLPAETVEQLQGSPEEVQRFLQDPANEGLLTALGGVGLAGMGGSCLAGLAAIGGLVCGFLGLSRETTQPTLRGRTYSTVGIVLSALPLLCCLCGAVYMLISTAGM